MLPAAPAAPAGPPPTPGAAERAGLLGIVAFGVGLVAQYEIALIGRLFIGELLLPVLAVVALLSGRGTRALQDGMFWAFVLAALVSLTGYIVSDLVVGSDLLRSLRGWARVSFLLIDVFALSVLMVASPRVVRLFVLGWGLGRVALGVLGGIPFVPGEWKLAYAYPSGLIAVAIASFLPARLGALVVAGAGAINVLMDSRSAGAVLVVVAAVLWLRSARPLEPVRIVRSMPSMLVTAALAVGLLVFALGQADPEFQERRLASNIGRMVSLSVGAQAIAESPWIGRGSWGLSSELGQLAHREAKQRLSRDRADRARSYSYIPESQIIASWYEGGILGAAFFLLLGPALLWCLYVVSLRRPLDAYTGLYAFCLTMSAWDWLMSPFGSFRITIALAVATIVAVHLEGRAPAARFDAARAGPASPPQRPPAPLSRNPAGYRPRRS